MINKKNVWGFVFVILAFGFYTLFWVWNSQVLKESSYKEGFFEGKLEGQKEEQKRENSLALYNACMNTTNQEEKTCEPLMKFYDKLGN